MYQRRYHLLRLNFLEHVLAPALETYDSWKTYPAHVLGFQISMPHSRACLLPLIHDCVGQRTRQSSPVKPADYFLCHLGTGHSSRLWLKQQ